VVAAAVVLAVSTLLVAGHHGPFPGEVGLLEAANGLPRAIGAPLEVLMQLGTFPIGLVVVAGVAVVTAPRGIGPTTTVLLAVLASSRLDNILKDIVERPRPGHVLGTITGRDAAAGFAFPSGHATAAFALAAAVSLLLPGRWRWVPFGLATGTAIARMYVGVHWPTDLIGGAALGTLVGTAAWLVVDAALRRARPTPA
jgi:undecaprenyl-diphosphatase